MRDDTGEAEDWSRVDESVARAVDEAIFFGSYRPPPPWYARLWSWVRRSLRRWARYF